MGNKSLLEITILKAEIKRYKEIIDNTYKEIGHLELLLEQNGIEFNYRYIEQRKTINKTSAKKIKLFPKYNSNVTFKTNTL